MAPSTAPEALGSGVTRMDKRWRQGVAVLLGSFAVLWPTTVLVSRGPIERKLTDRVRAAFAVEKKVSGRDLTGIDVSVSGRNVTLRGRVASVDDIALARKLAATREFVNKVDVRGLSTTAAGTTPDGAVTTTIAPELGRPTKVSITVAGSNVTVDAIVSDQATKDALLGPASLPADQLADNVVIEATEGTSNAEAHRKVGEFLAAALDRHIDTATFNYDNGTLTVNAVVATQADADALRADALALVGQPAKLLATINVEGAGADTTVAAGDTTSTTLPGTPTTEASAITAELAQGAQDAIVATLTGKVVTFAQDSATLDDAGLAVVDSLAATIKSIPSTALRFEVGGYTDAKGRPGVNLAISRRRADAVRARLIEDGIDPARLDAAGYGEARPVADNSTEAGRAQNRRIELKVLVPAGIAAPTTVPPTTGAPTTVTSSPDTSTTTTA